MVKALVSSHAAHGLMTARPQESLRGIIAARFIGRNCCHKMVTKVVFTFGTRGVFIIRSKQSDLHGDYVGIHSFYDNLIVLVQFKYLHTFFSVV